MSKPSSVFLAPQEAPDFGRGFFCILLHMTIVNLLLAALVGSFAWRAGVDPNLVAVIVWAAYRLEVALTNQLGIANLLSIVVHAENAKLMAEKAQHEARVAHIARNN